MSFPFLLPAAEGGGIFVEDEDEADCCALLLLYPAPDALALFPAAAFTFVLFLIRKLVDGGGPLGGCIPAGAIGGDAGFIVLLLSATSERSLDAWAEGGLESGPAAAAAAIR